MNVWNTSHKELQNHPIKQELGARLQTNLQPKHWTDSGFWHFIQSKSVFSACLYDLFNLPSEMQVKLILMLQNCAKY